MNMSSARDHASVPEKIVVVGNGMVGHRFVEELAKTNVLAKFEVTVIGEENLPAYDRVALSSFFDGKTADDLAIGTTQWYVEHGVKLVLGETISEIDRFTRCVTTQKDTYAYDWLVLATGSFPFVPPIPGRNRAGAFVYRTIDDLIDIETYASSPDVRTGVVIGGGLLGLEAANALKLLGLDTHVVEFAPRLMPLQLCEGGAGALRAQIEELGLSITTGAGVTALAGERDDEVCAVTHVELGESGMLAADLVVFSAGVRPRDELARACGLEVGERGGVLVNERCVTSDPQVLAIGECALAAGRVWGLVAPGYDMARVAASTLADGTATFTGADLSTKLKLLGIDVVSFGDAQGTASADVSSVVFSDATTSTYRRLVLDSAGDIRGGVLVGDADGADMLAAMARREIPSPPDARLLVIPSSARGAGSDPTAEGAIPDAMRVCSCNAVSARTIRDAVSQDGLTDVGAVQRTTTAGTGCGGCVPLVKRLVEAELQKMGIAVSAAICEHFPYSRVQLFDIVRATNIRRFDVLIASHGIGFGCAICKPTIASIFASLGSGYVLEGEQATLQDTNDHFLANIQKDGTYSVVPRVPGGEITPKQLIAIGSVAEEFDLYTKITGGQRIDLFGARVEQLPIIWKKLIDAGLESGHAYGKALRTVKSCVGQTWCRYGVQDSTDMAIRLELRYRGLRAPHKVKMAVSGCARECAEAQSKDVGVIATETGWNLYVGGNGGMRPRHADLLAENVSDDDLIRYVDRFFAFYIQTADRLERTATWIDRRPGGIDEIRRIVCEDSLSIASELEAMIEYHVSTYECEWTATLADPDRVARFQSFVNSSETDPSIEFVRERGQIKPAPVLVSIGNRR
jgi:nitrite reductase (NADH) large subunit